MFSEFELRWLDMPLSSTLTFLVRLVLRQMGVKAKGGRYTAKCPLLMC